MYRDEIPMTVKLDKLNQCKIKYITVKHHILYVFHANGLSYIYG